MKKELKHLLETFVSNGEIHIERHFNKKEADKIVEFLFKSTENDHPDYYFVDDDTIYIYEQFEIDASFYAEKMGSYYKHAKSKSDKKFDLEIKNRINNNPALSEGISNIGTFSRSIEQKASIDNLKTNFNRIFDEHYNEIDSYKNDLSNIINIKNKQFKIIFIIEHTTELGGFFLENGKNEFFVLHYADFVLDKLKDSQSVDYCIFLDKNLQYKQFVLVKNTELQLLYNNKIDTNKNKILFFDNVIDISSVINIPELFLRVKK